MGFFFECQVTSVTFPCFHTVSNYTKFVFNIHGGIVLFITPQFTYEYLTDFAHNLNFKGNYYNDALYY